MEEKYKNLPLRTGVGIIVLNKQNKVFIARRIDNSKKFDVILNLEIVEHVQDIKLYLKSCNSLLKQNGIMFTATLNRSFASYLKAIIGAEYILRWLPIGTHDWNKFLKPEELEEKLNKLKLLTKDISGLVFNPFSKKWKKSNCFLL